MHDHADELEATKPPVTDECRRFHALEAALRTPLRGSGHEAVLEAAKVYEAYLKGE